MEMKILHTSDLHLRREGDERWEALQKIIEAGKKENIDILVISGDLFDREVNETMLRGPIRNVFSQGDFKVVILPGNHDMNCYEEGKYYGDEEKVKIIRKLGEYVEIGDVRIWGFPFEQIKKEEVYRRLHSIGKKIVEDNRTNILLFHGHLLDLFSSAGDFGEEEEGYMPVESFYFKGLNFKYILAGHFHKNYLVKEIEREKYFVYPGSPVSITTREKWVRKVNLVEVGDAPKAYPLDTFHYEELFITLDPFDNKDPFQLIDEKIGKIHPKAKFLTIKIDGYINSRRIGMEEREFIQRIKKMIKERCGLNNEELKEVLGEPEIVNIDKIIEDDLFNIFREKMIERGYDENTQKEIRNVVLKAMIMLHRR
jgi:DNA repair exonuclease SbcCD nuclease subunit